MRNHPETNHDSPASGGLFGSLRARILLGMTAVALLPLLIMAYQGYHCARTIIIEQQQRHLATVLESRTARVMDWLAERCFDIEYLAVSPGAREACSAGCSNQPDSDSYCGILKTFLNRSESYEIIATYNLKWEPIDQSSRTDTPWDTWIENTFAARVSDADGLVVNSPVLDREGCICLEMAHPVFGPDGKKTGFLATCLNLSRTLVPILLDRTGLGESGKVYLVSKEGRIQTPPFAGDEKRLMEPSGLDRTLLTPPGSPQPETISSESGPATMLPRLGATRMVHEYTDFAGNDVLGAASAFPGMPFHLVAEIDRAEAFRPLGVLKWSALIAGLVSLSLALLVSVRAAAKLSHPLREMAAVAGRISQGTHTERLGSMDGTEAIEVAAAFNRMLDELASAQDRLSHAAALAAIGELSTSVVHEIRNPLSSIKVNLQALQRKVVGDSAHYELAAIASKQVDRVERMLGDLLRYGKPLEIKTAPVAFGDLAGSALSLVGNSAEEKEVFLSIDDRSDSKPIIVDREQMERAVANLVDNAIEAAAAANEGGEGRVIVTGREEKGDSPVFAIRVEDNGGGIPRSLMEKLFQPFVTTREEGTGLGLANVKKIAEYHGGTVTAENLARGAAFTIRLKL